MIYIPGVSMSAPRTGFFCRTARWRWTVLAVLPFMIACQGDHLTPAMPVDPAVLYWDLRLNHHAVTLSTAAPYDTLTLTATPRNSMGEPLGGLPAPTYRSTDPERVAVTEGGVLIAAQPTAQPVPVVATLVSENLQHVDTVLVRVDTATVPPQLGSFSIQSVPPDSAKNAARGGLGSMKYLLNRLVVAADTGGAPFSEVTVSFDPNDLIPAPVPVPDLLVAFHSSDTTIAKVEYRNIGGNMGVFTLLGLRPGTVTLRASTSAFGITKTDTLVFRIGEPLITFMGGNANLTSGRERYRDTLPDGSVVPVYGDPVRVATGGLVLFALDSADVTFADPTNVGPAVNADPYYNSFLLCFLFVPSCTDSGNIPVTDTKLLPGGGFTGKFVGRTFPVPGTYEYQSRVAGSTASTTGRIIVVDEN